MDPSKPEPMERLSDAWWASRSPAIRARRCSAHRRNGDQCAKVAMEAQKVCGTHGGRAPQSKAKARRTIEEAADRLARELLGMATNEKVSDAVKLAAIRDALDRAGLKPPAQVEVSAKAPEPWEEMVADGMATMSRAESRAARGLPAEPLALEPSRPPADVIDAEVVPDPPRRRPPFAEDGSAEPGQGNAPADPGKGYMSYEEALDEIERDSRAHNMRGTRIREIGM